MTKAEMEDLVGREYQGEVIYGVLEMTADTPRETVSILVHDKDRDGKAKAIERIPGVLNYYLAPSVYERDGNLTIPSGHGYWLQVSTTTLGYKTKAKPKQEPDEVNIFEEF